MSSTRETWREFWNRDNSIYVNDRHRTLHDDLVAKGIASLVEGAGDVVLDYGCGDASAAELVAEKCGKLYLYDSASSVRARLKQRFASERKIGMLEDEGLGEIGDSWFDLIVVNSVLQYVPKRDFEALVDRFRVKLKPSGRLVLADIVAPDVGALGDVKALLGFAFKGGFLIAACAGLITTFFSDYRKLRSQYGLTRYGEDEMKALLAAHGFIARRAPENIGHNQTRMLFEARPVLSSV